MDYHRLLNIIDIQKDAFTPKIKISRRNELFKKCMMLLFGNDCMNNTYNHMKEKTHCTIVNIPQTPSIPIKLLKKADLTTYYDSIPSYISYAIQDCGKMPFDYKYDLTLVFSPASYIDPGKRIFVKPNIQKELTHIDMEILKIPYLQKFTSRFINRDQCNIILYFIFENDISRTLNVTIDNKLNIYGKDYEYFLGNDTKNKWFNKNKDNHENQEFIYEGIIYIICKLLGDTLQVYYGMLFGKAHDTKDKLTCVFTCDKHVQFRSSLFDMPVVCESEKNKLEKDYQALYYPSSKDIPLIIRINIYNEVIEENQHFINMLQNVISAKRFYADNKEFRVNSEIKKYFLECIDTLEFGIKYIQYIDYVQYRYDDFKKMAYSFKGNCFLYYNSKNNRYCLVNNTLYFLSGADKDYDLICRYKKNIYDIIIQFSNNEIYGGSGEQSEPINNIPQILNSESNRINDDNNEPLWEKLYNEIRRIILLSYRTKLGKYSIHMDKKIVDIKRDTIKYLDWSVETSADYHASCICYTLENYFDILGRVFLDELFLSWFITSYFNEDIHMITHENFEQRFILRKNDFIEDRKGKKNNNGIIDLKNIEGIYIDTMYEFPNEKMDQNINSSDVFTFDKIHYPIAQTAGRSSNTRSKHMKNRRRTTYKKKGDERI